RERVAARPRPAARRARAATLSAFGRRRRPAPSRKRHMASSEPRAVDFSRVALDLIAGARVPRHIARAFWNEAPADLPDPVVADTLARGARYLGQRPSAH